MTTFHRSYNGAKDQSDGGMDQAIEVIIPLVNPNEPEVQISALSISNGQKVSEGDLLCTLETTKASNDLHAPGDGFVAGLRHKEGDRIAAGRCLCYLSESEAWTPPESAEGSAGGERLSGGLRITKPAQELARRAGLDLQSLPDDRLVTEAVVREVLNSSGIGTIRPDDIDTSSGRLLIYGGGGHGKSLIDLIRQLKQFTIEGIIDDAMAAGEDVMGVPVVGGGDDLEKWFDKGVRLAVNAVGGIGNINSRIDVSARLIQSGFAFPALVHPTAFVESTASIEQGVQIFPHAYVGSDVELGFGVIVNTAAIVSHDCRLGSYVNIAPGTLLAGGVVVEEGVMIGMGVTVNLGVRVGAGVMVGNSAIVKAAVPPGQIVKAGEIWPE